MASSGHHVVHNANDLADDEDSLGDDVDDARDAPSSFEDHGRALISRLQSIDTDRLLRRWLAAALEPDAAAASLGRLRALQRSPDLLLDHVNASAGMDPMASKHGSRVDSARIFRLRRSLEWLPLGARQLRAEAQPAPISLGIWRTIVQIVRLRQLARAG